jgi:radical SAM protein with 4Fe4S-binding SPASM domain
MKESVSKQIDKGCLYTTDYKVQHYSKDEEINVKLSKIIGEKFVRYRKQWDAVNKFELVTDFPLFLQLDMNQNCNLRCPHCIIGNPELKEKYYSNETLSWDDYKSIVQEGENHGCPSLSPQGNNEPLLIKDLEKYIKFAYDHKFIDIMMNTNALLLSEERAKGLLDSGLTRLRFSLDAATPETYSKVRPGSDYKKVVSNIERFLNLKASGGYALPVVGTSFCKMSVNEQELETFFRQWEDKVDIVTVQTFVPPILDKDFSAYYSKEQFELRKNMMDFRCPQPFQRVTIRNYDITPCCAMFSTRLKIGKVRINSIHEAWNSEKMNRLRELHRNGEYAQNDICRKCVDLIYPA